jgi:hypothetical protein
MDSTKPLSEIPARTGDERIKTNPIKKRIFAQEDIEKMKNMSEDEALEYKRKLVKLGKYNEIDIRV